MLYYNQTIACLHSNHIIQIICVHYYILHWNRTRRILNQLICFQVRSQYALCKRKKVPLLTYSESMIVSFEIGPQPLRNLSRTAEIMVDVFLVVYQLGIGCVYLLFIAKNNKMVSFHTLTKLSLCCWSFSNVIFKQQLPGLQLRHFLYYEYCNCNVTRVNSPGALRRLPIHFFYRETNPGLSHQPPIVLSTGPPRSSKCYAVSVTHSGTSIPITIDRARESRTWSRESLSTSSLRLYH